MTTAFLTKVGGRAFQEAVGICGWSRDHSLDARRDGCQVAFEGKEGLKTGSYWFCTVPTCAPVKRDPKSRKRPAVFILSYEEICIINQCDVTPATTNSTGTKQELASPRKPNEVSSS